MAAPSAADIVSALVLTDRAEHAPTARAESLTMKTSEPRTLVTHPELQSHQSLPVLQDARRAAEEPARAACCRSSPTCAPAKVVGALLLALNIFLLLAGYSLMKPARDGLILTEGGAELASYSAAAQAVLLMAVVPLYGWLGTRVVRIRLISIMMTFFAVTLVGFYVGGQCRTARRGRVLHLDRPHQRLHRVAVLGLRQRLYTEGQGRRLFPFIGVGQSLGAWVGAAAVTPLVQGLNYTPYTLMLLGACVLMVALAITLVVNRRETARAEPEAVAANVRTAWAAGRIRAGAEGSLSVLDCRPDRAAQRRQHDGRLRAEHARSCRKPCAVRYGSDGDRRQAGSSSPRSPARLSRRSTSSGSCCSCSSPRASYDSWACAARCSSCPALALVNYSIIAVAPILAVVRIGKILENSTDYSIQNTLRQALFLPTSREAKYKAKAAIDTFFTRAGDVVSAGFVAVGQVTGLGVPAFAGLNVALTGVWLWVAGQIAKEHRKKTV